MNIAEKTIEHNSQPPARLDRPENDLTSYNYHMLISILMKKSTGCSRSVAVLSLLLALWPFLCASGIAAEVTAEWIGVGYGEWNNPANWKDGIIPIEDPDTQYNVIVNAGGPDDFVQAALNGSLEVNQLTLRNALSIYGAPGRALSIRKDFHWLGGRLDGSRAQFNLYGESYFEGSAPKTLAGESVINIHNHARWLDGELDWGQNGSVNIEPTGVFDLETGGKIGSLYMLTMNNKGTIRMIAPGKTAKFFCRFRNAGLVDVQKGDIQFEGVYEVQGAVNIESGARLILSGASVLKEFPQSGTGEFVLSGGSYEVASDVTITWPTRIEGEITGGGTLTLPNASWESGAMTGTGITFIPTNGILQIQSPVKNLFRTLVNAGTVFLAPKTQLLGLPQYIHTNTQTGIIHFSSGSTVGPGKLYNQGTILKDDSEGGTATYEGVLNNEGLIRATAGCLDVTGAKGMNAGIMEAQDQAEIKVREMEFTADSSLVGNGTIFFFMGKLNGTVDTNLTLKASCTEIVTTNALSVKALEVYGYLMVPALNGLDARERLYLNGSLYKGVLRSYGTSELNFVTAEIKGGSRLELHGPSVLTKGSLTIQETNSLLLNNGTMLVATNSDLIVKNRASIENHGSIKIGRQLKSFKGLINNAMCRFSATNINLASTQEDGLFQITGPVIAMPQKLMAGPNAQLVFSQFGATNATVQLHQSVLQATESIRSSKAVFSLDAATISCPATEWTGSATLQGHGTINTALALQELQIEADSTNNQVAVNGALYMDTTNALFNIKPVVKQENLIFPTVNVSGPVTLNGRFNILAEFAAGSYTITSVPITLIEARQPIAGAFLNASNGSVLSVSNTSFRYRLFYGTNSPYGANKLVVVDFGSVFDQWRMRRFNASELATALISAPMADPDHNGLNNLTEFVLGFDPGHPAPIMPAVIPGMDGFSTIRIRKAKDVGGLQSSLAISSDLTTWQETMLGESPAWMKLDRTIDLENAYEYWYLYPGHPSALFLKISITGQY